MESSTDETDGTLLKLHVVSLRLSWRTENVHRFQRASRTSAIIATGAARA
jgi:hypothetical protein